MSLVTEPTSESIFQSINLAHISTGIQGVFNEVLPLLSADGSLDPYVMGELQRHMKNFSRAAGYQYMGVLHAASGAQAAAILATTWDDESPSDRLAIMVDVSEAFLLAELNISDAQTGFTEVKAAFQALFRQFIAQHGADLVIRIASKKGDGHLNIDNVSLQTLESRVMHNLEEVGSATGAFLSWLQQLQQWLQSFLQNKNASFMEKLEDTPFWAQHSPQKWQLLRTQMLVTYGELLTIRNSNPSWFEDSTREMHEDKAARGDTLQVPVPQVVVPSDPDPATVRRFTPVPHSAFYERIGTLNLGHYCGVKLESIESVGKGVSSIKFRFSADADEEEPLHGINIRCQYTALQSNSSPTLKQHHPRAASDLRNDNVKPPGCRTSLKVVASNASTLEWRFSSFRFWRRNTTKELPLNFPFSIDLEHSSDISLNIEVTVYRCDWLILKRLLNRHSADIIIRAPTPSTDTTTDLAIVKPVNTTTTS